MTKRRLRSVRSPRALQVAEEALTHRRILRRAIPEAERVFAVGVSMPSATTIQCSPMWTPSIRSATRSNASSAVERQAASCADVFATNRRLTAL
jgi:hypothetical protein